MADQPLQATPLTDALARAVRARRQQRACGEDVQRAPLDQRERMQAAYAVACEEVLAAKWALEDAIEDAAI